VRSTRRIVPLDVDDVYENKIKNLHTAIVAFIAEVQERELAERWVHRLYALQQASRDIVEAVKALKHLHKNLSRYGASPDPAVRELYDAIRLQVARILREIGQLRLEEPGVVTSLSLDPLKLSLESSYRKLMDGINQMIRSRRLSPRIATSLMNDAGYAYAIGENLIAAAHALLLPDEDPDRVAGERLALNEREIARIADTARDPAQNPTNTKDTAP